jgi:light-regulated signal transduction histidine kinase (bacteriophytochrome)
MGFIVDASKRMRTYITDLSTYSRIGTGNLVTEQIEVSELVDGVVRSLGTAIEEANAEVTVGDLPRVVGNRAELEQVFTNLLSNAVKFVSGENQPQIRISASPSEPGWQFSIADNGIGIDPRHADRIFEMFKRLHGPADYPGSGMGLALCRKVIERHGGSLWVESGSGDGSVFYFTIANQ